MKRISYLIISLGLIFLLAGCGSTGTASRNSGNPSIGDVIQQEMSQADAANPQETTDALDAALNLSADERQNGITGNAPNPEISAEDSAQALSTTEGIDIDLTSLSSTMVYAQVFSMMTTPEDFIGDVVKMRGALAYYKDENAGNEYFACIVKDATACCAQGIEFILKGDYSYPEDYPAVGEEVTVIGTFDTYMEGEYTYVTLRDASFA